MTHIPGPSVQEIKRLLESADYKLGWMVCYNNIKEVIDFITSSHTSESDLIKYAGGSNVEKQKKLTTKKLVVKK